MIRVDTVIRADRVIRVGTVIRADPAETVIRVDTRVTVVSGSTAADTPIESDEHKGSFDHLLDDAVEA